jgi:hypothetical protein
VGPEGVPATARELDYASAGPQAPHLVPLHERLMMRPSSGRGERSIKDAGNPGITVFAEGGLGTWLGTRWGSLQEQDVYYYVRHQYKDQARATWGEDVLGLLQGGSGKKQGVESRPASPNASLLFGRVVTMNSARDVIDDGVVGISGDTIIHVGTRGDKVPTELAGAPQVETSGTLYPGLIELHNHPAYNEIPLWDPPQKYTNRKLASRQRLRA